MDPSRTHQYPQLSGTEDTYLPLLNFKVKMEAQIGTLEQQGQQNLQRNKCSGHTHLHAFLGKLQIFQIFTYNIFSDKL